MVNQDCFGEHFDRYVPETERTLVPIHAGITLSVHVHQIEIVSACQTGPIFNRGALRNP